MNDIEVEILPTIGEAFSFKTRGQGRRANINKSVNDELSKNRKHAYGDHLDLKKVLLTSWNILKHPRATDKQKESAQKAIDLINDNNMNAGLGSLILKIGRTLNKAK